MKRNYPQNLTTNYVTKSKTLKFNKQLHVKKDISSLEEKSKREFKIKSDVTKPNRTNKINQSIFHEKSQKTHFTHQTLFIKKGKRKKKKNCSDNSPSISANNHNSVNLRSSQSLREKMVQKLKAARFRYLNEQMYTNIRTDVKKYFKKDPNAYSAYHEGYRQQVAKWPLNPIDVIIRKIKKLPQEFIIADFGCGEAKLAKSTTHTVHCFDLVAFNEKVKACDMAHVPLKDTSVDVVVFCLSLMGTNLKDYILEAKRVLKIRGSLLIAEVESRFEDVDIFIKNMRSYGFDNTSKDFSHNLFFFLDFVKQSGLTKSNLPDINLKPCLYKKR